MSFPVFAVTALPVPGSFVVALSYSAGTNAKIASRVHCLGCAQVLRPCCVPGQHVLSATPEIFATGNKKVDA